MLRTMQWPRLRQLTLAGIVVGSIALYFLLTSSYTPITSLKPISEDNGDSEFYSWRPANTSFSPFKAGIDPTHLAHYKICSHFPKHKLAKIQPVLKTGHGARERFSPSLFSTSACIGNLLIVSDMEEDVGEQHLVDVVGDIPMHLLTSDAAREQTHSYLEMIRLQANGTLDGVAADKIQGWKTDKFKFLSSVSRAWRHNPKQEWYVFYEDDSYIVWDTVFRLLEHFDPDKPHYFGSPSPGRKDTWFAYGGSGHILSRAAMWRLVKDDWSWTGKWLGTNKLSENNWELLLEDCCGDSILGWVLHGHEIDLEGLWPMFQPHSLPDIPFSDLYWCQPLLSMHRTSHQDAITLWGWEWKARMANPQRPILFRDIATSFHNITSFTTVRDNWDNSEWDSYVPPEDDPAHPHASSESCSNACEAAADCFQWTYHLRRCTLVKTIRVGRRRQPDSGKESDNATWTQEDQKYVAGWRTAKIQKWIDDRPCDEVQWVKPSIQRVF